MEWNKHGVEYTGDSGTDLEKVIYMRIVELTWREWNTLEESRIKLQRVKFEWKERKRLWKT